MQTTPLTSLSVGGCLSSLLRLHRRLPGLSRPLRRLHLPRRVLSLLLLRLVRLLSLLALALMTSRLLLRRGVKPALAKVTFLSPSKKSLLTRSLLRLPLVVLWTRSLLYPLLAVLLTIRLADAEKVAN